MTLTTNNNVVFTPEDLALKALSINSITPDMYKQYAVKRGLRDLDGKGVLTGLTEISEILAYERDEATGEEHPCEGRLYYRGYDVRDLVAGFSSDKRFGFEETVYLLNFGSLPNKDELCAFGSMLASLRTLPTGFVRDIILKAPSRDMMNALARCVLTLYSYDENPDDVSLPNVVRQCMRLVALFPMLAVYGYRSYAHYHLGGSLYIHSPEPELSTAENLLRMLRPDSSYSELEAKILDLSLVLHAEHGGGNNSTFTTHVVTSSGTDTYSAVAASLGSLKGPKHGGANVRVVGMFDDLRKNVSDTTNEREVRDYLYKLLDKQGYDRSGLIYGMGHAVYSLSDPRADLLEEYARGLSEEKNKTDEYNLYCLVAHLAPEVIAEKRRIYKGVAPNVDFWSGLIYRMLGLPDELFTPIFAVARIAGWSAHRIEELMCGDKIIRPAYKSVQPHREYLAMCDR